MRMSDTPIQSIIGNCFHQQLFVGFLAEMLHSAAWPLSDLEKSEAPNHSMSRSLRVWPSQRSLTRENSTTADSAAHCDTCSTSFPQKRQSDSRCRSRSFDVYVV